MKSYYPRLAVLLVALLFAKPALAAEMVKYEPRPGTKLTIDGDSTVHKWSVKSQIIKGTMELGFDPQKPTPGKVPAKVEVSIPVRSIRSDKKAMDDIMHETLKMDTAPNITYRPTEPTLKEAPKSP